MSKSGTWLSLLPSCAFTTYRNLHAVRLVEEQHNLAEVLVVAVDLRGAFRAGAEVDVDQDVSQQRHQLDARTNHYRRNDQHLLLFFENLETRVAADDVRAVPFDGELHILQPRPPVLILHFVEHLLYVRFHVHRRPLLVAAQVDEGVDQWHEIFVRVLSFALYLKMEN